MVERQESRCWACSSQFSGSTSKHLREAFKVSLKRFLGAPRDLFPECSSLKRSCFGIRESSILITWPDHLSWYFISMVWILIMLERERTSVSGILSCHLILSIFLRQFRWKRFGYLHYLYYQLEPTPLVSNG